MFIESAPPPASALQRSAMFGNSLLQAPQLQTGRRKNLHGTPPECCFRVDPDYKHLTSPE
jgi:hypothetical protein